MLSRSRKRDWLKESSAKRKASTVVLLGAPRTGRSERVAEWGRGRSDVVAGTWVRAVRDLLESSGYLVEFQDQSPVGYVWQATCPSTGNSIGFLDACSESRVSRGHEKVC